MRIARQHIPGALHHLLWRFVDRGWFFRSAQERDRYLWLLGRALDDSDWQCVAYALMSNHIHIAAIAGQEPLDRWSRRVNSPFANWMNQQRGRLGPLFADRPSDYAPGEIRAREVIAYIHNNPVRAGVVQRASESQWTSARAYLSLEARPRWLHVREGLAVSGMSSKKFDRYTLEMRHELPSPDLKRMMKAAKTRGSIQVGTPSPDSVPLVIRPYGRVLADPRRLVELVALAVEQPVHLVASRRRDPQIQRARWIAVHAGIRAGLPGAAIASALGVSQQSVSRIARHVGAPPESAAICAILVSETWPAIQ